MKSATVVSRQTEVDWVLSYHEVSKHRRDRYAPSPGFLDWSTQPFPFRVYEGAPVYHLPLEFPFPCVSYHALWRREAPSPYPLNAITISFFLYHSFALSAWKKLPGIAPWSLRVNPSSGNLHPTEVYLLARAIPGVNESAAIYHYRPLDHVLEERLPVPGEQWRELDAGKPWELAIVLTSIHWREAWKYGERAFRYVHLDTGHAIAAASAAARILGWTVTLRRVLRVEELQELLGLGKEDPLEAEIPHALLEVILGNNFEPTSRIFFLSKGLRNWLEHAPWQGLPNRLSPDHRKWPLARKGAELWLQASLQWPTVCQFWPEEVGLGCERVGSEDRSPPAVSIIRKRRSALAMDPNKWLRSEDFLRIAHRLLPRRSFPWETLPWTPYLSGLFLVHRVEGLPPGLYLWARVPSHLRRLRQELASGFHWEKPARVPEGFPLFLLKEGDFRSRAARASCYQETAADGAFCLILFGRLEAAIYKGGISGYAQLHWEAGFLGQWLYLEAEASGVAGTGIGCFFDSEPLAWFGLQGGRWQVIYHFSIGSALPDPRIMSWDPYLQS